MNTIMIQEFNIEDKDIIIIGHQLIKVEFGIYSDFIIYYTVQDTAANYKFKVSVTKHSFSSDYKILDILSPFPDSDSAGAIIYKQI